MRSSSGSFAECPLATWRKTRPSVPGTARPSHARASGNSGSTATASRSDLAPRAGSRSRSAVRPSWKRWAALGGPAVTGISPGMAVAARRIAQRCSIPLFYRRTIRGKQAPGLLPALLDGHVVRLGGSHVDLPRPANLGVRVLDHLLPVRDPARKASEGEEHGEHLRRDTEGAIDDARIEVYIWVQLALDEVGIPERGLLQLGGDVEHRIAGAELQEQLVAGLLDDLRPRVEVLVDAVAEAHQAQPCLLVLHLIDELPGGEAALADVLEHLDDFLVGASVQRAPERADACADGGEEVGVRAADDADGARRAVLLVIGVEDEEQVQRPHCHLVDLVGLGGNGEHHVQEV